MEEFVDGGLGDEESLVEGFADGGLMRTSLVLYHLFLMMMLLHKTSLMK